MNLFKKLSLLFIASFIVLLLNVFPIKSANAASFDVKVSVANDTNENKGWNNSSVDKCYSGEVEVQIRDANPLRTVKYTSGPNNCSHSIKVYNSPEAGEPTAYTLKLIKPDRKLDYIDVFNPATNQHATSIGSAISTNAISPGYRNSTVTFGLHINKLNVAYVLKDKNGNLSKDPNEECYTGDLKLEIAGDRQNWNRSKNCTPKLTINHNGQSTVRFTLPDNSDFTYAGARRSDDKTNHNVVTSPTKNFTTIYGDGTVYFFIKTKSDGGGGGTTTCTDPKISLDGKNGNTFHLSLKNPCNSEHNYQLKANVPGGPSSNWKAKISGNNVNTNDVISVGAGKTGKFNVVVTPPSNPSAGTHTTVVSATQKDGSANNKDTINLKTEIGQQQACAFKNPKLSSTDNDKNGQRGDAVTYNVELKNNNSACKGPADFNITVEKPSGWRVNVLNGQGQGIKGDVENLKSDKSKLLKVKVTSPNNAKKGETKEIKIKVAQKGHANLKDTVTLKYTVGRQNDNTCTGANTNPHFTCQNNACVAVNACGTSTGGCTQEGQACGDGTGGGDQTKLSFVIGLNTIGTTGTNTVALFANSNKNPQHPKRTLDVEVYNNSNQKVEEVEAEINYVADEDKPNYGKFIGSVNLADDFVTGNYTVKVKADGRLKKQIPGIQKITAGTTNTMAPVNLIAGDIDNDNKIGILDYGILISCSIFAKTETARALCDQDESYRLLSDLNDDGESDEIQKIDEFDYGYFIQEYSVQAGD